MIKEVRLNDKIWFGKYKDRTVRQILEQDKSFLDDLVNKGKIKYADNVVKFLEENNNHKRWSVKNVLEDEVITQPSTTRRRTAVVEDENINNHRGRYYIPPKQTPMSYDEISTEEQPFVNDQERENNQEDNRFYEITGNPIVTRTSTTVSDNDIISFKPQKNIKSRYSTTIDTFGDSMNMWSNHIDVKVKNVGTTNTPQSFTCSFDPITPQETPEENNNTESI